MKWTLKLAAFAAKLLPSGMKAWLYRQPHLAKRIRKTLNAASPSGLTVAKVAGGLNQGFQVKLDMQTEKDYWLGTYEMDLQAAVQKYCHPGSVVYDIGANIGYISLMFARRSAPDGKVFAFEPLPENFGRLNENVSLNHFQEYITTIQAAIVDSPGTTTFMVHESGAMGKAMGSLGREEEYLNSIKVEALAIDDFIFNRDHPKPDLIKMDIEGGEVLAIDGMQRTLREVRPIILVEIHSHKAFEHLWEAFTEADYELFFMNANQTRITSPSQVGEKTYAVAKPK